MSRSARYLRFLSAAVVVVTAMCAVGWLPTRRLAGPDTFISQFAGCAITLLSAALSGWLLVVVEGSTPEARMQRAFMAMILRLIIVVVLSLAAALSGEFIRPVLLFWMAATYVALLPLEVKLAIL